MKTKCSKSFLTAVALVMVGAGFAWHYIKEIGNGPVWMLNAKYVYWLTNRPAPPRVSNTNSPATHQGSNQIPHNLGFRERANELTDAEKMELTNLFVTKLKPAAVKWASVYSNRVPFNLADLNMDKFVERLGRDSKSYHSYTFVMGDITLGIAQYNDETEVQYLASRSALTTMGTMPTMAVAPDLSMPVTRQDVMAMAEADSGQQIPPNLVQLIPSAESGSLVGGAIVDVGSEVKNAMGIPISKANTGFSYVFAKDGTLAYYLRTQ